MKADLEFNQIVQSAPGKFHGGIHPKEYKSLSNETAIGNINQPSTLILPIQQSVGKAGKILVSEGEKILTGQLLVECSQILGANIHAPLAGIIKKIESRYIGHPSGIAQTSIIIQVDKVKTEIKNSTYSTLNWQMSQPQELLARVRMAGIVGLGGATFPTDIKLSSSNVETLIVNAMECEPYITCDDRLLRESAQKVIIGAQITAKIISAKNIIFAIEDNKKEAIKSLNQIIVECDFSVQIKVLVAPTKYPSGGEKQTIELVTGKQLPSGKLPSSIGVLIQNVATLYAVHNAVIEGQPLTSRLVTLTGNLINQPGNYKIPFGTTINEIIKQFNIDEKRCERVIVGGPLMGISIEKNKDNFPVPVTKSTNCLIFNAKEPTDKLWLTQATKHQECIRCGECEKVCPAQLLPQQLYWFSQSDQWNSLEKQGLFDCIECGACAYVCPSEIPLVQYYRYAKSVIQTNQQKQKISEKAKQRFEFREMRLARTKKERALKHQQAAETRKKTVINKADPSGKKSAINEALERVKQKKAEQHLKESKN